MCRYLLWLGFSAKVFNVGSYRRKIKGVDQSHNFFDPNNSAAVKLRNQSAEEALNDLLEWLNNQPMYHPAVGIFDATNSTRQRRRLVYNFCVERDIKVFFIESICDDENIITSNIKAVKLNSPDYANMEPSLAAKDFKERINHYIQCYETIGQGNDPANDESNFENAHYSYIKMINMGSKFVLHLINDYLQSKIVFYLMNLHVRPRSILLSRHGESMLNFEGRIGGDSDLSPRGKTFADNLPDIISKLELPDLKIWTSTLKRTIQTAEGLKYPKFSWKALDELDAGVCDSLTYEEIAERYPEDYANRDEDKYNYRYKGGESYHDVVLRLEPVIMELERQDNIYIIGHQAILRCIYAYFMNYGREELPYIDIPLHTVIELKPGAYGCEEARHSVPVEAVDTFRRKPYGPRYSVQANTPSTPTILRDTEKSNKA